MKKEIFFSKSANQLLKFYSSFRDEFNLLVVKDAFQKKQIQSEKGLFSIWVNGNFTIE
jgi:plasmid maintenance system killer protein